jgi:hypothetical protein
MRRDVLLAICGAFIASVALLLPACLRSHCCTGRVAAMTWHTAFAGNGDASNGRGSGRNTAAASLRKACVDALMLMLKSEDPALQRLEGRICRGLQTLHADEQAQDVLKRRRAYASGRLRRSPFSDLSAACTAQDVH